MEIDYFVNAFTTLFVTIDPIGLAPIFLAVTAGARSEARRAIAYRACLIAFGILVTFTLVGNPLLSVLGISIPAFRIAGGLLLFWTAFEMVFEKRQQRKTETAEKAVEEETHADLAVFPLAIPLISGPGSISAALLLATKAPNWLVLAGLIGIIAVLISMVLVVFLLASSIHRHITATAQAVLTRLLGVLLAALAVQFVAEGVKAFGAL
ncbi:MAG: MarC family transcriptional regulator [Hyphomicrobiales bacterium]|nr:MAG: MarC family transcriptional regulator [Hyphomicrobiales bacterium]